MVTGGCIDRYFKNSSGEWEYFVNWFIHGNKETRLQSVNGSRKQLNANLISTGVWQTAKLHHACKCSQWPLQKNN